MTIFWLVLMIVLIAAEAATVSLVSIWFALGALAALITSVFNAEFWVQLIFFAVISAIALIITRPLAKKIQTKKRVPTNLDKIVGQIGIVREEIDNIKEQGSVYIDGKEWTARSKNNEVILSGKNVTILEISGVKVIVEEKI